MTGRPSEEISCLCFSWIKDTLYEWQQTACRGCGMLRTMALVQDVLGSPCCSCP